MQISKIGICHHVELWQIESICQQQHALTSSSLKTCINPTCTTLTINNKTMCLTYFDVWLCYYYFWQVKQCRHSVIKKADLTLLKSNRLILVTDKIRWNFKKKKKHKTHTKKQNRKRPVSCDLTYSMSLCSVPYQGSYCGCSPSVRPSMLKQWRVGRYCSPVSSLGSTGGPRTEPYRQI